LIRKEHVDVAMEFSRYARARARPAGRPPARSAGRRSLKAQQRADYVTTRSTLF